METTPIVPDVFDESFTFGDEIDNGGQKSFGASQGQAVIRIGL